jgi:hypothetical protein
MTIRLLLSVVLVAHGVAHLVGFVSSWRLVTLPDLPYRTTILGGLVDLGDAGIRVVGVLWLVTGLTFVASAWAVVSDLPWWQLVVTFAFGASIVLCTVGLPDSRLGFLANGLVLALAVMAVRTGALARA